MCSNSTDCDDGQFCHVPDGESEGECHTQVTLTAYIQESINNLTTTTPKPKPKGVNSILFPSIWLKCEKLFDYIIHVNAYFPISGVALRCHIHLRCRFLYPSLDEAAALTFV